MKLLRLKIVIIMFIVIFILSPITIIYAQNNNNTKSKYIREEIEFKKPRSVEHFVREEFRLKFSEFDGFYKMKMKSGSNFEVAIANSDGSYDFVDTANTLEEGISRIESLQKTMNRDEQMPVVLDSNGYVVYSNYSMARIYKHINGKPYPNVDKNSDIFQDSNLSKVFTYINHGYAEDAPIISVNGTKSAKIQISGLQAWIRSDKSSADYDILIVPVNQAVNPSYYIVKDGILKHFISTNLVSGTNGSTLDLGKAPAFLKPNVKYFSYDGRYFYDGSDRVTGLINLISDLQNKSKAKSVNPNSPHYVYYQNLPFRSKTVYSATDINSFLSNNTVANSKLRGIGEAMKSAENTYGVNALTMMGIAINESAWGTSSISQSKNNIFGLNAVDSSPGLSANEFKSVADCVNDFAKNWISRGYSDPADWRYYGGFTGCKSIGLNIKYASDPYWGEKANKYAFMADLALSSSIDSLRDSNKYAVGIYTGANEVRNNKNVLLYKVGSGLSSGTSYTGTTFILNKLDKVNINSQSCYEINPERNTPVNDGGSANKFQGNYNWNDKGYIKANNITLINNPNHISPTFGAIGGSNRYETCVSLSKSAFKSAQTVVIVNNNAIIDGVTASALATALRGPILLGLKDSLTDVVKNEIKRLGATNAILIGGEGILSKLVENELKSIGVSSITRLGGKNRYETALAIAKHIDKNFYDVSEVFLVNGLGEADALSAGAISGQNKIPVLLTTDKTIFAEVKSWLSSESLANGYLIGGTGVLSDSILNELNSITSGSVTSNNRLGGSNRYNTNAIIIDRFYPQALNNLYVAKGDVLIDALTAGPVAGVKSSPIVLVGNVITEQQKEVLYKRNVKHIVQAGLGVASGIIDQLLMNISSK